MLLLIGLLLVIFFGLLLSLLIAPKMQVAARLGLAYILGLGILTLLMFYFALLGCKFTLQNTLFLLLVPIFILLLLVRKRLSLFFTELKGSFSLPKLNFLEKLLLALILILFGYSLFFSLYWPIHAWDSLVLYDFRGKLFFQTGSLNTQISESYFWGYPLLTSLGHTIVYLFRGSNPLCLYSLFFISFGLMFYGALKEFTSRLIAFFSLFFLLITPPLLAHSITSYTNLPYTIYFVMGTIYAYIWIVKEKRGYLTLSALLIGLSAWTRKETPFWIAILAVLILFSLVKKKFKEPFFFALIFFAIRQPWEIFITRLLEKQTLVQQAFQGVRVDFYRFFEVLAFLNKYVVSSWGPLVWLVLAIFILDLLTFGKKKNLIFFLMIFICFLLLVSGTYIFSFHSEQWKDIPGSASRLSIFFPPLFIYYLGISRTTKRLSKQTRWKIGKNLLKR